MAGKKTTLAAAKRRATQLLASGRSEEALAAFRELLDARPDDAGAWDDVGWALNELELRGEAVRHFDRALAIDPTLVNAWIGRGMALVDDPAAAVDSFDRALALDPGNENATFLRGVALDDLRRS